MALGWMSEKRVLEPPIASHTLTYIEKEQHWPDSNGLVGSRPRFRGGEALGVAPRCERAQEKLGARNQEARPGKVPGASRAPGLPALARDALS